MTRVAGRSPDLGRAPQRSSMPLSAPYGPDRMDGCLLLAVGIAGMALFAPRIDWLAFAILFWTIDAIGYWPGLVARRIAGSRHPPVVFVYLYNLMHSLSGGLALAIGFALLWPQSIAAALAIPVHFGIDRGLLGNRLKRRGDPF